MKKYLVVALIATGLFVSACGGVGGANPVVTVTATQTQTVAPVPTEPTLEDKEYMFLETMRNSGISWLMDANPNDLLDLARQTCQILDNGYTVNELVEALAQGFVNDGLTNDPELYEGTGMIIGSSIAIFCPEYGNQI